jgi:hypothetical protein
MDTTNNTLKELHGDTDGDLNIFQVFDTVEPMPTTYAHFPSFAGTDAPIPDPDDMPWLLSVGEEFEGNYSAEYNEQKYNVDCPCGETVEVYVSDRCGHCGRVFKLETRVFVSWKEQE